MSSRESRAAVRGSAHRRRRSKERPPNMSDLRIVLLGKSVSDNSRVGNFLLGRAAFDSEAPPDVVERVGGRLKDRHMMVINSPQLLQTNISAHQITQTVRECVYLSDPGPHVIVLLLKHDQCSTEDQECVQKVLDSFSERVFQHTMVLTTQEPTETNDILQKIIQKCSNRHFSLQRRSSPDDLLQVFEDIVQMNDGRHLDCAEASQYFTMKQQATERSLTHSDDGVRIVLLGKTGVGKSATGNTILRREAFKSLLTSQSVTRESQKETTEFNRRQITVIDTPGLFDTGVDNDETRKENVMQLVAPGPHVFLLVIQLGRFTQEDKDAVKIIQDIFGEKSRMYTIVLFTRGDDLGKTKIEDYVERNDSLKKLVQQCGQRYHVFNNNETKDQTQVSELLDKIDCMVAVNGGSFYSNEMFQKVEKNIKEEQMRILKEKEEEIKSKEEELRAKYEAEMEQMKKENEREIQEMQNELRKRGEEFKNREEEIKKEIDENLRKEMKRKLEEQQKQFEEENKRKEKALEEQQQNFIKYLEEKHEKEKQNIQERIQRETREQAEREYLIKVEEKVANALKEAQEKYEIEKAKVLQEAEEKYETEKGKILKEAEEKYETEKGKILKDAEEKHETEKATILKDTEEKHKTEKDKALQEAEEKHKREKDKALHEAEEKQKIEKVEALQEAEEKHKIEKDEAAAAAFQEAEKKLPYSAKLARDWNQYVPVIGGTAGGFVGSVGDIVYGKKS